MTDEPALTARDEAIRWHVRLAECGEADWEEFVAWLEADAAHGAAYDAVEAADADIDEALALMPPPREPAQPATEPPAHNDNDTGRTTRRRSTGLALAAAVALAAFFGFGQLNRGDPYEIATAPGETRTVTLASGDRVDLNGATRLRLDRDKPRFAAIEAGEATFTVRHMPGDPFVVLAGDERIEDIGTVFNVVHADGGTRVAVAEGSVIYNPRNEAVTLVAGQSLDDPGGNGEIVVGPVEPNNVGTWRSGRLSYTAAPLSRVVADLARRTGETIALDPPLGGRPFSGTIMVGEDKARALEDLAELLGLGVARGENGWMLTARGNDAP